MKNRKKLQSVLSMALVLLLVLSSCAVLVGAGRAQPENPIGKRQEQLRPETASGSSSLWGENGESNGANGNGEAQEETQPPEMTEPPDTTPTTPPDSTQPTDPEGTDPTEETQNPTENTDPNTDPDNPDDGKDDNQGGDTDSDDKGGNSDTDDPNKGDSGNDGDDGGDGGKGDNPSEDDTPRIYTDLYNNMSGRRGAGRDNLQH